MGAAIDSLRPALSVSRENPSFLIAALVTLAGSGLARVVAGHIPVVGGLVNSVFVTPAFAALMLGIAAAGLATDAASIGDGVESLRANYRRLAGAYAILVGAVLLVVVGWAVEVAIALLISGAVDPTGGVTRAALEPTALAANTPVVALTFLALAAALVGGLAVQFFDVAIVVGGESATASFGASWRLFRTAPGSVLGYSVLRLLPIVVAGVVVAASYVAGATQLSSTGALVAAGLVAALVGPPTFAFATAYHVAYYEARIEGRSERDASPGPADGAVVSSRPVK